jgi:hypothetical protein
MKHRYPPRVSTLADEIFEHLLVNDPFPGPMQRHSLKELPDSSGRFWNILYWCENVPAVNLHPPRRRVLVNFQSISWAT